MNRVDKSVERFLQDERGLTTVEYAIAGALVAAALVASFVNLGTAVAARISSMAAVIS